MWVDNNFHISYCSNIHPGSDWEETYRNLQKHLPEVRDALVDEDEWFGIGLRLSNKASEELAQNNNLDEFRAWLDINKLYVFTMNGFPYGNFHNERVKDQVHTPDWTTTKRLSYTFRLFDQLAFLLPEGVRGGISTSPISYKHWHKNEQEIKQAFTQGAENLARIVIHLHHLELNEEKFMHLDIEPEPDGLLENTNDVISFFKDYLLPVASPIIEEELSISKSDAVHLILRHITLCYDTCHFALAYEEPYDTFTALAAAGIQIGKIQVSAALKILSGEKDMDAVWKTLEKFDEPVYLHQVTEKKDGKVVTYADLPDVLSEKKEFKEMRAHFHVPVFTETYGALYSTQDQIKKTLSYIRDYPVTEHLEVETYTWEVLPEGLKMDIGQSIIRELEWLKNKFET